MADTFSNGNIVEQTTSDGIRKDPRYVTAKPAESESMGVVEVIATVGSFLLMIVTLPFSLCVCFKVVQEYERAVIFRLGRLRTGGARGPGIFFVLPCMDTYCKVDLRTVSFDVPPQEVLTKDSVTVSVDAVVYYKISEPLNAVVKVANYSHSTRLLAATTLRNVIGTRNLSELLTEREAISHTMQATLDEATDPWGVKVERVEIKDVSLPTQLQRAMAAEAEATREARAKVIAAEGEMNASKALKEASDVMSQSPAALQKTVAQGAGLVACSTTNPYNTTSFGREVKNPYASALVSTLQIVSIYVLFIMTLPFSLCFCIHTIREYERGIVFRYGNLRGDVLLPGLNLVMFIIDKLRIIDLRVNSFEIPEQEVLTRDAISIDVSAVVYYHVFDPVLAVVKVFDFHKSTEYMAANTLRDVLSANDLSKLLTDRAAISKAMRLALDAVTNPWGININCLEIKELFFPEDLQRAMASEAEATQLAKARVISAEGEHVASEALQKASMTTSDSPGALQLSYLQTLVQISAENNETVVFPMPFHLLNAFKGKLGY